MVRKWRLDLTFYGETPEDELDADNRADEYAETIRAQVESIEGVIEGSVEIIDLDTIPEEA